MFQNKNEREFSAQNTGEGSAGVTDDHGCHDPLKVSEKWRKIFGKVCNSNVMKTEGDSGVSDVSQQGVMLPEGQDR